MGMLRIIAGEQGLRCIEYLEDSAPESVPGNGLIQECINQMDEYFRGQLKEFDLPLDPVGSEFDKAVWRLLSEIEYGSTCSYKALAIKSGNVKNIRAVGGANRRNPIPIVVPCHRVIGADGSLVGYAGGLQRKKWLLHHEGVLKEQLAFFDE